MTKYERPAWRKWIGGAAGLLILGGLAGCGAQGAERIVYESYDGDVADIYIMHADATEPTRLTSDTGWEGTPALSPDGQRIIFASDKDGDAELYLMNPDGSDVVQLTDNTFADLMPAWSPDGTRIAFVSDRTYKLPLQGGHFEIEAGMELYVMNADGSKPQRLTGTSEDVSLYPTWSPDGSKLAYMNVGSAGHIFQVDSRAATETQTPVDLTPEITFTAWSPRWSPDGKYIVLMGDDTQQKDVYRMDASGQNILNLTEDRDTPCVDPTWSPEGKTLIFASVDGEEVNLYTMTPDGKDKKALTQGAGFRSRPQWGTIKP